MIQFWGDMNVFNPEQPIIKTGRCKAYMYV